MDFLEPELLRTFLEAVDAGGVMLAASRVGRTRAAVSLQMRRLEHAVGQPLFHKVGRRLELTPTGEMLTGWARRLLGMNAEALAALRNHRVLERLRLGAPQDVAERWLPSVLASFTQAHPEAQLELVVEHSKQLAELQRAGQLDLCVRFALEEERGGLRLGSARVRFFAATAFHYQVGAPLPLVLLEPPCIFRSAALRALDQAELPWRIAVTCPSVSAMWAAVAAGLGVTARAVISQPRKIRPWSVPALPTLPKAWLSLHGGETGSPGLRALKRELMKELRGRLGAVKAR